MKLLKRVVSVILSSLLIFQLLFFPLTPALAQNMTVNMEYDNRRPLHAPKKVNGIEYQYDDNGNLVNDGEREISWNQDNMPTKIKRGGNEVKFFYDADGQRIVKKVGEKKTIYVNQYYQVPSTKYYFANGKRIAQSGETIGYLYYDHLGSVILLTDSQSQPLAQAIIYFPYGNSIINHQSSIIDHLFTGQEYDQETELYNYKARLYNPKTGTFISADTLRPQHYYSQILNRYAYVENNPLRYTDPTGLHIPEETPAEYQERIIGQLTEPEVLAEEVAINKVLDFANFMKQKFGNQGVTAELWEPVRSEVEEKFGVKVAEAITRSVQSVQSFPNLQCVGFARASWRTIGRELPPLGMEMDLLGKELPALNWYENLQQVQVGDLFVYQRQEGGEVFWHWAVVTEKIVSGEAGMIKLTEAVGSVFQSGDIYVPAGGIMVNLRTVDLSSGEILGMDPDNILGFGFYRPKTEE